MGGELIALVAVTLGMGVPLGALYTYYRVRKLRSEERLAAIARGVNIPMEPEPGGAFPPLGNPTGQRSHRLHRYFRINCEHPGRS